MIIKIRAEGGARIGLGHWSRSLFLASCIDPAPRKILFTKEAQAFKESFPDADVEVIALQQEEEFVDTVRANEIVLFDLYDYPEVYANQLRNKKPIIVHIDDFNSAPVADVIINQSPLLIPAFYKKPAHYASFFLGTNYSLVASSFNESQNVSEDVRKKTLLIAMGGADPADRTASMLTQAMSLRYFERIEVIVGAQYNGYENLSALVQLDSRVVIHRAIKKEQVAACMQRAGVAFLSASTMALEYAHCRGLLGIVQTVDNQENLFQGLIRSGAAMRVEEILSASVDLDAWYEKLVANQRMLFDGKSADRFRTLFNELQLQQRLNMRRAAAEDKEVTFAWASDPAIRAYSFSKAAISWEGHSSWFDQKITSSSCLYLIASIDGKPVGSIRFDKVESNLVVSYLIDKSFHGKGLGRILLAAGMRELTEEWLDVQNIIGYVQPSNIPSVRIFERLGFSRIDDDRQYPGAIKFYKKIKK
jgi:UDP-2,4-diacetamido-2,4,6-trideoxy-beta-L-altropyranose hydrolase